MPRVKHCLRCGQRMENCRCDNTLPRRLPILILLAVIWFALNALAKVLAHSGGLNGNGCHGGSQPYHCHRSASDMVRTQSGHWRLRCDLGSNSSECSSNRSPQKRQEEENDNTNPWDIYGESENDEQQENIWGP